MLTSKTAKLRTVKDQLIVRYLRLGWKEAYHTWSCNNVDYTPVYLLNFFIDVVIPLSAENEVPIEPPVDLPSPSHMPSLDSNSSDANRLSDSHNERVQAFKDEW